MKETQAYTQTKSRFSFWSGDNANQEMNQALRRCRASLFRNAYRFLNNEADAEDAVQDALLSAYKHIDQFRGEAQMSTWLTAIVSNTARMQLRKRPRQIHVSLDEPIGEEQELTPSDSLADGRPSPEDQYRESELHARVKGFVAQLSPALRETFQLRAVYGLTINEAARILGVPNGTVKARLARARAKLSRLMGRRPVGRVVHFRPASGRSCLGNRAQIGRMMSKQMLSIAVADNGTQRRLVVEGQLINSAANELRIACEKAGSQLNARELVIELNRLTAINQEAENLLLELMRAGVTFRSQCAFTKHILAELARRLRKDPQEWTA